MTSDTCTPIFECTQCGDCCNGYGGTVISDTDARRIAQYLNIPLDRFVTNHCVHSGSKRMLSQQPSGYCTFWDQTCTIHPVKPDMCRAWPFIKSVLVDVANWRIMAASCPGMRTDVEDERIYQETRQSIDFRKQEKQRHRQRS